MINHPNRFKQVSFLFLLSGFATLSYQIVWTRLLLYTFGNTTYSVIAVLAAFMAGLGIGGYIFGRLSPKLRFPLRFFAYIELGVGLAAIILPRAFVHIDTFYTAIVHTGLIANEIWLVLIKFSVTSIVILPITTLMGGTFPVILSFFAQKSHSFGQLTSSLYAMNIFGAILGVLFTAFIAIELFGLTNTMYLTSLVNFAIFMFLRKSPAVNTSTPVQNKMNAHAFGIKTHIVIFLYGLSGITAMALEVLWIRLLTPTVGTYIYAFSLILLIFLAGLTTGSLFYKKYGMKVKQVFRFLGYAEMAIAVSAFLSVVVSSSGIVPNNFVLQIFAIIFPGTFAMGTILPAITQLSKKGELGPFIGKALLSNSLGSTCGPIVAGFLLIPVFGTTRSILIIASVSSLLAFLLFLLESHKHLRLRTAIPVVFSFSLIALMYFGQDIILRQRFIKYELALHNNDMVRYLEDEVATMFAYTSEDYKNRGLIIDGVETTRLVSETKLIAHIPLLIHPNPKRVLIIALGMGTTFRSSLSHDIEHVDVVELVPSVVKTITLFHPDAQRVLDDNRGKIIVNDGRQFVHTSQQHYDVVTIDPPPPINSAGTTVLYSREFYQDIKKRLNQNGLVQQWFFFDTTTQEHEMKILLKTFIDQFKYVLVFASPHKLGISVIGSNVPLEYKEADFANKLRQPNVLADLSEWEDTPKTATDFSTLYIGKKNILVRFAGDSESVTDNYPRTEYFLLRRIFMPSPFIQNEELTQRISELAQTK